MVGPVLFIGDEIGKRDYPLTHRSSGVENYPWMIKIELSKCNGLAKKSAISFSIRIDLIGSDFVSILFLVVGALGMGLYLL